jgi:HEAT repeat protein
MEDFSMGLQPASPPEDMAAMIADYMEKGFLENIEALFRQDPSVWPAVARLVGDERMRVRLGAAALVEELSAGRVPGIETLADYLVPLLTDESPLIRGDAAYCVGLAGGVGHVEPLEKLFGDENPDVRESARDAVEEIRRNRNRGGESV